MTCRTSTPLPTRREMLRQASTGFGLLALASLLADQGHLAGADEAPASPLAPRRGHFPARAKHVIFLFMDGGVSQVDSFDPKPRLQRENGQPFGMRIEATQFDRNGRALASPFAFARHGRAGIAVSSLFPHLARCVDDLCVIRSMRTPSAEHAQSCYMMHTGHTLRGRPSMGAWATYGLGSTCANLPGFVVLDAGQLPLGGLANFGSGFLPALHEGSLFQVGAGGPVLANIQAPDTAAARQRNRMRFIGDADRAFARGLRAGHDAIDSAIHNYELAFAMQAAVPEVSDLRGESRATLDRYGVTSPNPLCARYARQCLLARRLVERGVRFIELTCVAGIRFVSPWDSHDNIRQQHQQNADVVDQPIAALLADLKARGLLDETLILFASEFGRTPFAQGSTGRDHNPHGFSIWLAGGGVKGGYVHGATDEYGYHAVEGVVTIHDLHATILHLLGLDHTRLTYRYAGRDFRLTDVEGEVVQAVLA
jgi:hypothetical protein